MSSVDFSDQNIWIAHDALLRNAPTRWFLLEYGHGPNVLVLSASGTGDVDELRTHLKNKNNVCYGVFREHTQDDKSLYISINYIPNSVKGVWRARTLVHVTAVASNFKVHEVLTISDPDQLSVRAIRSTLNLPPRIPKVSPSAPPSNILGAEERTNINHMPRKSLPDISSVIPSPPRTRSPSVTNESQFRSSSKHLPPSLSTEKQNTVKESDIPSPPTRNEPLPSITPSRSGSSLKKTSTAGSPGSSRKSSQLPVTSSISTQIINESRVPHTPQDASWLAKQESPLPPPPDVEIKDHRDAKRVSIVSDGQPPSPEIGSIPDSNSVASLHIPDPATSSMLPQSVNSGVPTRQIEEASSRPIDGLPPSSLSSFPMSQPIASSLANSEAVTNRAAAEDPKVFSALTGRLSRFQERASSPADAAEERKLVMLEEERRRRSTERLKREKEFREEEEARQREFEERKEREKKRRLENARKSEVRRVEQKRQQEEEEAGRKAEKERKDAEVRERRNRIKKRFEKKQAGTDILSGFVTLESSSSWKRRYYRISTEDWIFFKNDEDTTTPMHALELSRIRAIREWNEGYEELEAIPNSFAVEFKDDAPCLFFADSAEDKEILVGLLNQAAGL